MQVDKLAALDAAMRAQWQLLHTSGDQMRDAMADIAVDVSTTYSVQGLLEQSLLPQMEESLNDAQLWTEALYESTNQINENMDSLAAGLEELNAAGSAFVNLAEEQVCDNTLA